MNKNLIDLITNFKTKYEEGLTVNEVENLILKVKEISNFDEKIFDSHIEGTTQKVSELNEPLFYKTDLIFAIHYATK